ncbi:signal peptide containing protein [Theileria equi strain WA]|uniref:Signal peptide containing protein n=1 Tax=Theileria equi strain WA TaxID=1537102 RepID=L1LAA7_THEEQ|nr:signal peptide containing protein [Theileria equi strain WA]EKX72397.1 signal peptide containing protein [Theileria equi strain WA]|eukprot:XP_004831849.1 signal peptide containing protein [Theileria equi strain WA]
MRILLLLFTASLFHICRCGNETDEYPVPPPPPPPPFHRCTCGDRFAPKKTSKKDKSKEEADKDEGAAADASEIKLRKDSKKGRRLKDTQRSFKVKRNESDKEKEKRRATISVPEDPVLATKNDERGDYSPTDSLVESTGNGSKEDILEAVQTETHTPTEEGAACAPEDASTTEPMGETEAKKEEPVVRAKEYLRKSPEDKPEEVPLRPSGLTIDIATPDTRECQCFKYHHDEIPIVLIVPKTNMVKNIAEGKFLIWTTSPGEKVEYSKMFLKNGEPEMLLIAKSCDNVVRHTRFIKHEGVWEECKSFKGRTHRLKVPVETSTEFPLRIEDEESTKECTVFQTLLFGVNTRFYSPNPGYVATEVFYGKSSIWIGGENERCISCDLYSEMERPSFILLTIKDVRGLRSKYYRVIDGEWKNITAQDFEQKRRETIALDARRKYALAGTLKPASKEPGEILTETASPKKSKKKGKGCLMRKLSGLLSSGKSRKPLVRKAESSGTSSSDTRSSTSDQNSQDLSKSEDRGSI